MGRARFAQAGLAWLLPLEMMGGPVKVLPGHAFMVSDRLECLLHGAGWTRGKLS